MALGVGTYSDGFGVAFTLLDQFSAIAKKIESSMASLTTSTGSFVGATNAQLKSSVIGSWAGGSRSNMPSFATTTGANTIMGKAQAQQQMNNALMGEINLASQIEEQTVARAAVDARLLDNRMQNQRLFNSLQREQLIIDRQLTAQLEAEAAATEALAASRQTALALLGVSMVGFALLIKGAKTDAAFEKAELTIEGFVGSAEKAHQAFLQIQQDTNKNPFMGFQDRLQAFDLLLSQGVNETVSQRVTNNLSNLLTAVGRGAPELRRVSRELEKIAANGKLTGRELYQAAAAGIPLRNILEDYFGTKLPDTLKDLPITIDDLDKALQKAMIDNGRYAKALDKILDSTTANWSSMTNNIIPKMFVAIGYAIDPITKVVVSALGDIFKLLEVFSESWIGRAFWALIAALTVFAAVVGLNIVGGKAFTWVLARLTHGLGHATIATLRATIANEGLAASFTIMGEAVLANPAFLWFTAIASTVAIASSAIHHFKSVMSGQDKEASGWTGTLQKLGGLLMFVSEAFATYDASTHKSTFDQNFVTAIDKLGLHDITAKLQSWIGAIMSFTDGFTSGLYSFFSTLYDLFELITTPIRWVLSVLGLLTPGINNTNDAMDGWRKTGIALSWVLGTLLVGQLWKMGAAVAATVAKIVLAEGELMAFTLPLLAELWPAMVLIAGSAFLIADNMDILGNSFNKARKPIDEATIAMQEFNKAQESALAGGDAWTKAAYFWKEGAYLRAIGQGAKGIYNDAMYMNSPAAGGAIKSPNSIDLSMQQQQQAQIDTARGNSYPETSYSGSSTTHKEVNVTLQIGDKQLAQILVPLIDDIRRKEQITSNYG